MASRKFLFFIIIMTACLTQVAADVYTPSIPAIADFFATKIYLVEWTMVSFIFGTAISQLFFGPLSEGIGSKTPIMTVSVFAWFVLELVKKETLRVAVE